MCNDKLSVIVFQHFVLCPSGFSTALLSELSTCLQYTYDIAFICLCVFNVHRLAGSKVCSRNRARERVPGNLWKVSLVGVDFHCLDFFLSVTVVFFTPIERLAPVTRCLNGHP